MKYSNSYALSPGFALLFKDLGIQPANVLRRAGLPEDLFKREGVTLSTPQYFALCRGLREEANDPLLPLRIGQTISVELFDAPIFASLCSPDLNTALQRLSRFKRLLAPIALHVEVRDESTTLDIEFLDKSEEPPVSLVAIELVFFVQLARIGTREEVKPLALTTPYSIPRVEEYTEYFGQAIEEGPRHTLTFSAADATRPFLTANAKMWNFFEPELRKRLSELDESATMTDRVRGVLFELLPGGTASLQSVSKKLAVSTRTLQRRLHAEEKNFQLVLDATREELARHYLASSQMSGSEISLLLGYEDPNSFFRAFHAWTGETPEQARAGLRIAGH